MRMSISSHLFSVTNTLSCPSGIKRLVDQASGKIARFRRSSNYAMRQEEINKLSEPYTDTRSDVDRRFDSVIGADVPSAIKLFNGIAADLDTHSFGISWWQIPVQERILISDYLYQCADGIEKNLVEAKLHYLEWLDVRERQDSRIADGIRFKQNGEPYFKHPPSQAPIDDLIDRMEGLHLCGFFRAIGSSLDCLGAVIPESGRKPFATDCCLSGRKDGLTPL